MKRKYIVLDKDNNWLGNVYARDLKEAKEEATYYKNYFNVVLN